MSKIRMIKVRLCRNPYNIYIGSNIIKDVPHYLEPLNLGNSGIIVTTDKIYALYKKLIKDVFGTKNYKIVKIPDGERAKSKPVLFKVIDEIIAADGWQKKVFIICFGGGTVGDLGGFAAAIYKRGIPYVQIPTTLLAQIDAGIGGKTAIDLPAAKNILGAFYQPRAVFIDALFLNTLADKELKEGLAEAIKYGIIRRKKFFYFLKDNCRQILALAPDRVLELISVCAQIKADVVAADERETKGVRTQLNFGHTLAHALEASFKYKKISHGEAVALGMLYAACLSLSLGKCCREDVIRVREIIEMFSLPVKIKFNHATLCKALSYDKKFISGQVRMVLLREIGRVEVVEGIPLVNIRKSLKILSPFD